MNTILNRFFSSVPVKSVLIIVFFTGHGAPVPPPPPAPPLPGTSPSVILSLGLSGESQYQYLCIHVLSIPPQVTEMTLSYTFFL